MITRSSFNEGPQVNLQNVHVSQMTGTTSNDYSTRNDAHPSHYPTTIQETSIDDNLIGA